MSGHGHWTVKQIKVSPFVYLPCASLDSVLLEPHLVLACVEPALNTGS